MSDEVKLNVELTEEYLVIKVPRNNPPKPSKTGKSFVVASTYGNHPIDCLVDGKQITLGVNAYISAR